MMKTVEYISMGGLPIKVGFTDSPNAFKKEMKRLGVKTEIEFVTCGGAATTHFLENTKKGRLENALAIVTIRRVKRPRCQIIGLLAHEATHVWQEIRRSMREKEPSAEFEAYTVGWLVQAFSEIYRP